MELGIGLPNAVPGTTGKQLTDWARAAEEAGFNTLGTIDRIVYPNYEPIVALSAAAAVTERIRLATDVMLGPLRQNPALVAKQVLSLDALAGGGRAVLGIGLGGREDDYEVSGIDFSTRQDWIESALPKIRAIWNGDGDLESEVGPRPQGDGPTLLVGGYVQAVPRPRGHDTATAGRREAPRPTRSRRASRTSRRRGRGRGARTSRTAWP